MFSFDPEWNFYFVLHQWEIFTRKYGWWHGFKHKLVNHNVEEVEEKDSKSVHVIRTQKDMFETKQSSDHHDLSFPNIITRKCPNNQTNNYSNWVESSLSNYLFDNINSSWTKMKDTYIRVDWSEENFPKSILTMVFGCQNASGWAFIKGKNFEKLSQQK